MAKARSREVQKNRPSFKGKPIPNPVLCREGRGVRHFTCLYYDACLDKAAKGMWTGFTCIECPFYPDTQSGS